MGPGESSEMSADGFAGAVVNDDGMMILAEGGDADFLYILTRDVRCPCSHHRYSLLLG